MDRLTPPQIARRLFFVNLPLGLLALALIVYHLLDEHKLVNNWGVQSVSAGSLLILGTICELVYFLLAWQPRYAASKALWIYTIVVNGAFIVSYIVSMVVLPALSPVYLLIIYPLLFLRAGYIAYKKLGQPVGPA